MLGMIIKNMRLTAGLYQKELGEKLALADNTISSYERSNSQPTFDTIAKICEVCGFELMIKDNEGKLCTLEEMSKEKDFNMSEKKDKKVS